MTHHPLTLVPPGEPHTRQPEPAHTEFIGRDDLLHHARTTLLDPHCRLLTLTGPGGVGKTSLARHLLAHLTTTDHADIVWIALSGIDRTETRVDAAIAEALGLGDNVTTPTPHERLVQHWRGKTVLAVLDNCEHLLDGPRPALTTLTGHLLSALPGLTVLATSRVPFKTIRETVLPVPPLSVATTDDADSESLQLLLSRAHRRNIPVTTTDHPALHRLTRRLGGLPLALELIASRLDAFPPHTLDDLLTRNGPAAALRLLGPDAAAPDRDTRHAGIDTAIAWSYELLDPPARALWAALSVLNDTFDLPAAHALAAAAGIDEIDTIHLLATLVEHSVLTPDHHHGQARYRMSEVMRWYGQRAAHHLHLDLDTLRAAHAHHYTELAATAAASWAGPEELTWVERLHHALPNLRAAHEHHITTGDTDAALRLAIGYVAVRAPIFHGIINTGRYLLHTALHAAATNGPSALTAVAHAQLSFLAGIQGDCATAAHHLDLAHADATAAGTPQLGPILLARALLHWYTTDQPDLTPVLTDLDRAPTLDPDPGLAVMCGMFAALAAAFDADPDTARHRVNAYRMIVDTLGAPWAHTWALIVDGVREIRHGSTHRAAELLHTALTAPHTATNIWDIAWISWLAAVVASRTGRHTTAAALFGATRQRHTWIQTAFAELPPWTRIAHPAHHAGTRALGHAAFGEHHTRGAHLSNTDALTTAIAALDTIRSATHGGPLTERQTAVAELVAQGLTNHQIGRRLHLSDRTVEGHITAACKRLHLPTTRTALATHIAAQPAAPKVTEPAPTT